MIDESCKRMCAAYRCGWHGFADGVLTAHSPFDPTDILTACPQCNAVNQIFEACDEPGCWRQSTCGTPVVGGYRRTCGEHCPKVAA